MTGENVNDNKIFKDFDIIYCKKNDINLNALLLNILVYFKYDLK
jgi:hypothetical protein